MADAGTLIAEREDTRIKLTMTFPDGYDHCFVVERLAGLDDEGEEVWEPIHSGTSKFVQGEVDYHWAHVDPNDLGSSAIAPPGPQTYRALPYRLIIAPHVVETHGDYTDTVTV